MRYVARFAHAFTGRLPMRGGLREHALLAQQMHPTALFLTRERVVALIPIAHHDAGEVAAQHVFGHLAAARAVPFEVAHRRGEKRPDVPVLAVFPPTRLIRLHHRRAANLRLERVVGRLAPLRHRVEQHSEFAHTDV